MHQYLYQNWLSSYGEIQTEENTLRYYRNLYKSHDVNRCSKEQQQKAKKFLKTCTCPEEWAGYAYTNSLEFQVCKPDGPYIEAYLEQDMTKDVVIFFLDENDRKFMFYVFRPQDNGKLFLIGMKFFEYIEGKSHYNDYIKVWVYAFEPNGNVVVTEKEKDAKQLIEWKSKQPLNVESNWEEMPKFGEWDSIFRMKRWEIGELHEAFKGEGVVSHVYDRQGKPTKKTNYPYNHTSNELRQSVEDSLARAKAYHEKGETDKIFDELQSTYYKIPQPRENYEITVELLLKIVEYYNLYNKPDEAIRIIDLLPKYLNVDNHDMLPLHKGKVYFQAGRKKEAAKFFDDFISENGGALKFGKDYPEHFEMYVSIR